MIFHCKQFRSQKKKDGIILPRASLRGLQTGQGDGQRLPPQCQIMTEMIESQMLYVPMFVLSVYKGVLRI